MDLSDVIASLKGVSASNSNQPDGDPNFRPLSPVGLDKAEPEPFPANVTAQQGAGGGYLYPGAQGQAADGTIQPGNEDHYSNLGGPPQLPAVSNVVGALTGDGSQYHGRPDGGTAPAAAPVGRPDYALGRDQSQQGINPMLKSQGAPNAGPLGKPSEL